VSTAYHQVTVAEIARGSNSSPATFYHYFTDVAAATAEVAEAHFRQLEPVTELARRLQTLPVTEERSREFVVALMDFWKGRGGLLEALIIADSGADPRFFRVLNRSASEVSAALAPLVNGAPQIGTAGALVMMICHATAREQGFAIGGVSREELVQSLSQIVFRTLSVGSDRPGDRG
jgi:AcrR family transcriptional regulator